MAIKSTAKPKKTPGTGAPAPTAFGTDLSSPASPGAINTPGLSGPIADSLMRSQNQANSANQQRYGQQLGVLSGGYNTSSGYLSDALNSTNNLGLSQKDSISHQLQQNQGQASQSAVSRGIYNTTALNGMQNENQRLANSANLQVDNQVAQQRMQIQQAQAQNANQGAGSIASAIASRNDVAPNPMQYAQLQQQASAATPNRPGQSYVQMGGIGGRKIGSGYGMFMA